MSIFGLLFFVIIFILLFIIAFVAVFFFGIWNFIRRLMGKEPQKFGNGFYHTQFGNGQQWGNYNGQQNSQQWGNNGGQKENTQAKSSTPTISGTVKPRTSKIDKNEGEYVDFEEV